MAANMTTINLNGVPYRMRADMVAAYNEHAADRDPFAKEWLENHPVFALWEARAEDLDNGVRSTAYDEGYEEGYREGKQEWFDEGQALVETERNAAYDEGYDEGYADAEADFATEPAGYDL